MDDHPMGLKERMDERFDDVDRRFGEVDRRMDERFDGAAAETRLRFKQADERYKEVGEHIGRMDVDIRELRVAVNGMQRTMLQGAIALSVSIIGTGFVTLGGLNAF